MSGRLIIHIARNAVLAALAGTLLPMAISSASSQEARNVKVMVPFPQGGGSDMLARLVAQRVEREQRQRGWARVRWTPPKPCTRRRRMAGTTLITANCS